MFFKDIMFTRKIAKVFKPGSTKDVRMALALAPAESKKGQRPVDLCKGMVCRVYVVYRMDKKA